MHEVETPSPEDLIDAYVSAETLPDFLPQAETDRIRGLRRKAALAAIQKVKDDTEEVSLAMHHAYRPEVVAEVSVPLGEESDWEQIAKWCGGTIDSGPDGTDSGEWTSWITLPSGEEAVSGMWITKGLDGTFRARHEVAEPDETTLRQVEALGWERGAATALSMATRADDGTLKLSIPNPGQAFLPSSTEEREAPRRDGHVMRVTIEKVNGLTGTLICTEPTSSPCRQPYGDCELVAAFDEDPPAALEDYRGVHLSLLDAPIRIVSRDEYEIGWTFVSAENLPGKK